MTGNVLIIIGFMMIFLGLFAFKEPAHDYVDMKIYECVSNQIVKRGEQK